MAHQTPERTHQVAHRQQAGWTTRVPTEPYDVAIALLGRQLVDVETCHRVWLATGNPLAVCEAVRQLGTIPQWLEDALLVLLTESAAMRSKRWRAYNADLADRDRALAVADARANHPLPPWPEAAARANELLLSRRQAPATSPVGMRRVYQRVRARLTKDAERYYRPAAGFSGRLVTAWERLRENVRLRVSRDQ